MSTYKVYDLGDANVEWLCDRTTNDYGGPRASGTKSRLRVQEELQVERSSLSLAHAKRNFDQRARVKLTSWESSFSDSLTPCAPAPGKGETPLSRYAAGTLTRNSCNIAHKQCVYRTASSKYEIDGILV